MTLTPEQRNKIIEELEKIGYEEEDDYEEMEEIISIVEHVLNKKEPPKIPEKIGALPAGHSLTGLCAVVDSIIDYLHSLEERNT